jgi:hypothetical protein
VIGEGIEEASAPLKSGKTQDPHVEASWAVELADRLGRRSQQKRKQRFEGRFDGVEPPFLFLIWIIVMARRDGVEASDRFGWSCVDGGCIDGDTGLGTTAASAAAD